MGDIVRSIAVVIPRRCEQGVDGHRRVDSGCLLAVRRLHFHCDAIRARTGRAPDRLHILILYGHIDALDRRIVAGVSRGAAKRNRGGVSMISRWVIRLAHNRLHCEHASSTRDTERALPQADVVG